MKKGLALLLSSILAIPSVAFGAVSNESIRLQSVIEEIKSKIEVPNQLTEFNYHLENENYRLFWNDTEGNESINVQVEEDGDILYYHHYKEAERSTLAKINYEVAKENARVFLKQVVPEYEGKLVLQVVNAPTKDNAYRLQYQLQQDGIKVFGKKVYIEIDKQTGEVIGFSGISYDDQVIYSTNKPKLNLEEAELRYLESIGAKLSYQTRYRYDKKEDISFLAYEINNNKSEGISALSGEVLELYREENEQPKYAATEEMSADSSARNSADGGLTPSEQKAVDESKGLLSADTLKSKWQPYFKVLEKMTINRSYLYQEKDSYVRKIICEVTDDPENRIQAELYVNAVTGELLSYDYVSAKSEEKKYVEWTQKEADTFLEKVFSDHIKQVVFESVSSPEEEKTGQDFYYQRQVNGLPVAGEGIYFTYDTGVGEVTSYHKNWSEASFKKPEGILNQLQIVKKIGLELVYMEVDKNEYELAYNHEVTSTLMDAWKGISVNYYGDEKVEEVQDTYTDIKGHLQEAVMTKLFNSGIYLNTTELKPDEAITQEELLALLVRTVRWGSISEDNIYEEAYELGILDEKDKRPDQVLSKEEGISYLIKATPYKKVAMLNGIYQYPYKDVDVSENDKGAIAIAYGFGWLEQTEYFKPKDHLTKAEAMVYIYHLLEKNSQDI